MNPENTFYSVKRFVGRQPNEVGEELKEVSYKVDFEGQKVKIDCPVLSKKFAPEEVSAQVLRKLSGDAGTYLSATVQKAGCPPREGKERACAPRSCDHFLSSSQAVVTVPAYFNDSQRQAHATGRSDDRQQKCLGIGSESHMRGGSWMLRLL